MRKLLMCPPHYYNVAHHMQNAHMRMSREVLHNKAQKQWIKLYSIEIVSNIWTPSKN